MAYQLIIRNLLLALLVVGISLTSAAKCQAGVITIVSDDIVASSAAPSDSDQPVVESVNAFDGSFGASAQTEIPKSFPAAIIESVALVECRSQRLFQSTLSHHSSPPSNELFRPS